MRTLSTDSRRAFGARLGPWPGHGRDPRAPASRSAPAYAHPHRTPPTCPGHAKGDDPDSVRDAPSPPRRRPDAEASGLPAHPSSPQFATGSGDVLTAHAHGWLQLEGGGLTGTRSGLPCSAIG